MGVDDIPMGVDDKPTSYRKQVDRCSGVDQQEEEGVGDSKDEEGRRRCA